MRLRLGRKQMMLNSVMCAFMITVSARQWRIQGGGSAAAPRSIDCMHLEISENFV